MTRLPLLTAAVLLSAVTFSTTAVFARNGTPGGHFIANWDADGDGTVSLAEATAKRGDVFSAFDADEDGRLSADEYAMFDEARANDQAGMRAEMAGNGGKGHGMGMNAADGMTLGFNDTDADGFVSRDEFIGHSAAWITQMDRNADGRVTADDFGRN